jgi:hypothetical protein
MKKILILSAIIYVFASCGNQSNKTKNLEENSIVETEYKEFQYDADFFENWKDEDWIGNDNFRFLRKCFDDFNKGIENENTAFLQAYKTQLQGQFFIMMPSMMFPSLGMHPLLIFLDNPSVVYIASVYKVGTNNEYLLRYFEKTEFGGFDSREQMFESIKNNKTKLW